MYSMNHVVWRADSHSMAEEAGPSGWNISPSSIKGTQSSDNLSMNALIDLVQVLQSRLREKQLDLQDLRWGLHMLLQNVLSHGFVLSSSCNYCHTIVSLLKILQRNGSACSRLRYFSAQLRVSCPPKAQIQVIIAIFILLLFFVLHI